MSGKSTEGFTPSDLMEFCTGWMVPSGSLILKYNVETLWSKIVLEIWMERKCGTLSITEQHLPQSAQCHWSWHLLRCFYLKETTSCSSGNRSNVMQKIKLLRCTVNALICTFKAIILDRHLSDWESRCLSWSCQSSILSENLSRQCYRLFTGCIHYLGPHPQ